MLDNVQALHDFVHTHHVTGKRVAFGINDFFKIHLIVYAVRHTFAYITCPAAGTACSTGTSERNGIFATQHPYTFQTLPGNDIAGEYVVIFVDDSTQVRDELLYSRDEVRVQVCLYASNGIVVHYQTSAASFFEHIQNHFTVTESVKESCQCAQVHGKTGVE